MKTIRKEEDIKLVTKTYQCEVCGNISEYYWRISQCEKDHKQELCSHNDIIYRYDVDDDYDNHDKEISKECKDCDKVLWQVTIEYDFADQKLLKKLYESISLKL